MFEANGVLEGVQKAQNEMLIVHNNHEGGSFSFRNASNDASDGTAIITGVGPNCRTMYVWGGCFIIFYKGLKLQQ